MPVRPVPKNGLCERFACFVRRVAVVAILLVLVVGAGVAAFAADAHATSRERAVGRRDRAALTVVLAKLSKAYFGQVAAAQEATAAALGHTLARQPADGLDTLAGRLPGADAAVLMTSGGEVLGAAGEAVGLDSRLPGLEGSLRSMLAAGEPGVTPILDVGGRPSVVVVVPGPAPATLLAVAYRLGGMALASYGQSLAIGPGAVGRVVDAHGRVLTSAHRSELGRSAPAGVLAAVAGRSAGVTVGRTRGPHPLVVAAAPVGLGGYRLVVSQPAPQFYGVLWHGNVSLRWTLLALLVVVAAALLVLHARRQAAVHAVADMAVRDPLTGLPNRLAFTQALEDAVARHRRDGIDVALLFCDLDGFKTVNDRLGHAVGDRLLVAVADRLHAAVDAEVGGRNAMMARLGGDEFTVLLEAPHATPHAQHLANALTEALARPFVLSGEEVRIGVSIGVAYAHPERDLLRDADVSMYRTKAIRRASQEATTPDGAGRLSALGDSR